ncbi:MAG: DUF5698 domain-containing protein [Bacteroidales bacterium]|nr:DUF5698 domain-containing protein [Bacteroidales bacterium]
MFDFLDQYPYLLPVIIFFGRICDVTLGTLRIIFVSKGEKNKAPIIGFFEVLIWIIVISQIFSRANNLISYVSYAAGYAVGNYVGIIIESRIALGVLVCRIYTNKEPSMLVKMLTERGYGSTTMKGMGTKEQAYIIETVVERKALKEIDHFITVFDQNTFYTAEDVRIRQKGVFPKSSLFFKRWRLGK